MSEKNIGLVNFFINNAYGSIYKFCPSKDFMDRLKNGKLRQYSYYESYDKGNETQEYNRSQYELLSYSNYFKENYNLNIIGYIDQSNNFYMISRFLNRGLTFIVINATYNDTEEETLGDIDLYMNILNKNAPNAKVVFLLRYPDLNSRGIFLQTMFSKLKDSLLTKYPNCFDVLIHPFKYIIEYDDVYSTFADIQDTIKKFYEDESHFIKFNELEQKSLNILLKDPVLKQKTIYTEKTVRAVCNNQDFDTQEFMNKIIQCGLFYRFPGDKVNQYFFKAENDSNSIVPLLTTLVKSSLHMSNKNKKMKYYLSSYQFKHLLPKSFKKRIPMGYRLLLKLLSSIKFGRATLSGEKIYFRLYDYTDFGRYHNKLKKSRFIYS